MKIDKLKAPKYCWGQQCESFVLLATKGLYVKQEMMPGHTKEEWHYHQQAQQFFYILTGEATFHLEDETILLNTQEGISVAPGNKHFIENKTASVLEFLVISQPSTDNDRIPIN